MSTKCFSVDFAERDLTEKEKETSVLHCWITITTKNKIAKYHENIKPEGSFIGALFRKSNTCPNQGLFISVALTKQLDSFEYIDQDQNDNKICLEASTHFFKHYAIPRHCRDLFFKPVFCLPLERVILGVKSDSSYRRSTSSEWKDHLTVLASTRKLLCRNKDYLMPRVDFEHNELAKDFFTVDCNPVNQGYISVHTEIIVIKLNNDHKKPNTESYMELINYMLKNSLLPHGFKDAILPIAPKLKEFLDSKTSHELKMVVAKSLPQSSYDIHNSLFAHNYVLENKKLKNGDWVEVSVRHQGKELADITIHRLARIFTLPPHSSSDAQAVFVSPQFRLNAHSETTSLLETNNVTNTLHLDKAAKNPEYADECHLALVQSPHYNATLVIDDLKENYFSIPRYVKVGDVIALPSTDNVAFHQQLDDRNEFRWPVIYLKASKIIPHWGDYKKDGGYLVDNQNSKIYVLGTVKSYIPVTMETFLSPTPTHPFLSDAEPAGLRSYLEKLHSLVFPLLEHWFENKMVNCNVLLTGPIGCGKSVVVKALCRCLNLHLYVVNCHDLFIDPTVDRIKSALNLAQTLAPCIMLLKNGDCVGRERESVEKDPKVVQAFCQTMKILNTDATFPIVTIATSSQLHSINAKVNSVFLHHIQMEVPTEKERFEILESLFSTTTLYSDVSLAYVAQRTAGLVLSDLNVVANLGAKTAYWRMKDKISKLEHSLTQREMEDVCRAGIPICQQDLIVALEEINSSQAQAIGALKIPNVKWDDVGGLLDVKNEIIDTIQLPLQHPELLLSGLRRSGVLLYGPPGTGKTLLAKAVATECSLNFLSVKGPELINMYVGQSEQNVREIFGRARSAAPCIIFFDEIDSLAPNRGRSGDSGGVMDRLVSQLLAEMDGLNKSADVFVIGATNRPDLLDPALLRPGRFDRLLYVGIAEDRESRMKILSALTRKFPMSDDVDLELVEAKCPPHLTGADFYSLCSGAYMNSIRRNIVNLEKGEIAKPETEVNQDDFMFALKTLTPSVSEKELLRFQSIHASLSA